MYQPKTCFLATEKEKLFILFCLGIFHIIDQRLKKPLETNSWPNLETQIANTSKAPLFGGIFCKFKGVPQTSPGKDPDFCAQRPKKHIVDQIHVGQ